MIHIGTASPKGVKGGHGLRVLLKVLYLIGAASEKIAHIRLETPGDRVQHDEADHPMRAENVT